MKRSKILMLTLLSVTSLMLTACGSTAPVAGSSIEEQTVEFYLEKLGMPTSMSKYQLVNGM